MKQFLSLWKNRLDRLIPPYAQLPLICALGWNLIVYYGTKLVTGSRTHWSLALGIDARIPFLPWTVCIYIGCYLFWVGNYLLAVRQSKAQMERFLSAEFLAKSVCLVFFLVFPTTIVRPEVPPDGFWNTAIRLVYQADSPVNLFPSIHCLISWFCYLGIRKQKRIPVWYRGFSLLFALAVFVSTLTTRQHVLADVLGGVILAAAAWQITVPCGFAAYYGRFFDRLRLKKKGRKNDWNL